MFWHLYKYRIKVMSKNYSLLFWTLAFPIVLGLLFNFAFSGLDNLDVVEPSDIAVVAKNEENIAPFTSILEQLKVGEKPAFKNKELSAAEAQKQLEGGKISGYYSFDGDEITLHIAADGISQTILKEFLDQYLQQKQKIETLLASGQVTPEQLTEDYFSQKNFIEENEYSKNGSTKSFYFFTLVGMACMYGFFWGLRNVNDEKADQSPNGIRLSMAPTNKLLIIISNMLAAYTLFFLEILIQLAVFHFVYGVDFGQRWGWIILTCALGCLCALAFGSFIAHTVKGDFNKKSSIAISLTMMMSFLAGMMGTEQIKYTIDMNFPILGRINLVNLLSESFYQLYYYSDIQPFFTNILYLIGFTVFFILANFYFERKAHYDHL
ncbi:ABC transporter permease [Enterococcus sp. CWB-B31]|uniref:ABC transporter permease n=1 Tax=Enterococcus sp. CWB-B31 TaxID=2885159 RepID=UPI001E334A76|nr:ABC transporter permease [Enterococcus sp. CWB-B31]MCB5953806.1 ABC transporter permease [Enterococcus sp. CWB-B31]